MAVASRWVGDVDEKNAIGSIGDIIDWRDATACAANEVFYVLNVCVGGAK